MEIFAHDYKNGTRQVSIRPCGKHYETVTVLPGGSIQVDEFLKLTPEEAEDLAAALMQAAEMARETAKIAAKS